MSFDCASHILAAGTNGLSRAWGQILVWNAALAGIACCSPAVIWRGG